MNSTPASTSPSLFQSVEEKAIELANKLQSGFALNQENYELLLNNFSMRLNHKKFMTDEDKEFIVDLISPLAAQNGQSTNEVPQASKGELQAIENLQSLIEQKRELYDALEQSVAENQNTLIEEEKVIEFLERNNTSNIEALDTHLGSYNPSEVLTQIFEINNTVNEKDKIENNPNLYMSSGGMLSKLKVSLFSNTPQSVYMLQELVQQYDDKKNIVAHLRELKTYLLTTASLEEASEEAEAKLNEKREEINEMIESIEGGKKKMKSLYKEITTAQQQLDKLMPESERLSFKESVEYLLANVALITKPIETQNPQLNSILLKTYGPNFEAELPSIVQTYESVNTDLAQTVESLENIIQLNQSQKKQFDFALKRSFSAEEKQNHQAMVEENQSKVLSQLHTVEEKVNSFFKAAFDSEMGDYLDGSLAKNSALKEAQTLIVSMIPALSALDARSKSVSQSAESSIKNRI